MWSATSKLAKSLLCCSSQSFSSSSTGAFTYVNKPKNANRWHFAHYLDMSISWEDGQKNGDIWRSYSSGRLLQHCHHSSCLPCKFAHVILVVYVFMMHDNTNCQPQLVLAEAAAVAIFALAPLPLVIVDAAAAAAFARALLPMVLAEAAAQAPHPLEFA